MSELKSLQAKIAALEEELSTVYEQLEQEKNDIFNSIVETTPTFIAIIQDERFVFVNSTGLKLLQCKKSNEIIDKSLFEVLHPDLHSLIKERLLKLKEQKSNEPLQIKLRTMQGEYITLEASSTSFLFNNKPAGLIAGRDITKELVSTQKIEEEEKLRTLILDSLPELIALYEPDHKIKWMNKTAKDFYDITDDSYIGEYCYKIRFNSDTICKDCPLPTHKSTHHTRIVHDKDIIWKIRHTPLFDTHGNISGYVEHSVDITEVEKRKIESKEAEKNLRESEQRFREIFENSNESIFLLEVTDDMRFRNLDCNTAFEKSTGLKRGDLIGKFTDETVPEEASKKPNEVYRRCVETKEPVIDKEIEIKLPVGSRYYLSSIIPIPDSNGKIYRILGITRDITDRKVMEEALTKRERDFRTLAENAPDPIYRYDRECRRVYVNPVVEKVGKIPIASLLGKTPTDGGLVSSEESLKVLNSLQKVLRTGKRDVIDVLFVFPDGREIWTQNIHVPEFGSDGTVESVLSIGRDITERKQREKYLKDSFNFIEKIINSVPEPIFIKDRQHKFIFSNTAHSKFRGLTHDELINKTDFDLFPAEEAKRFWEDEELIFETGKETKYDDSLEDSDGNLTHIVLRKVVFIGSDGKKYLAGTIHDITERVQAEEILYQREQEFRTLVENSPDTVVRYDINCNRVYFNPAFQKIADLQASDLLGTNPKQLSPLSNDQALMYLDTIKRTIDTSLPQSMELHILNSDSELWYNMKAVPEFDKNGNVVSVLSVARDVTELNKTKKMSEMLSFALNSASDAVFIYESQTINFTYVNGQACRSLGYSQEELVGMSIFDIDPDVTPEILKQYAIDLLAGNASVVESRHKTKEGKIFPVEITSTLYRYDDKAYVMNVVQDISERKKAEIALRENEEKFSTVFKLSPASLSITRLKDNVFLDVNDVFLNDTGLSREEVVGHNQYNVKLGIDINSFEHLRESTYGNGGVQNFEYTYTNKNGKTEYALLSLATITIGGEECILSQTVKITELKFAEKELRRREQEYRTLVENSPDIIVRYDLDYKRVYVNQAYLKISKYSKDELIGRTLEELSPYPPYASMLVRDLISKAISSTTTSIDLLLPDTKGDSWFNIRAVPEFDNQGKIESVMTISRDITELKQKQNELIEAGKKLQESEKRYRLVFENSPVSIWEEDFSEVKVLFDELKSRGVNDIGLYMTENPEVVQKCAELAKIVDVNQSGLVLHKATSKSELMNNLVNTFTPQSFETFKEELIAIWNGKTQMISDTVVKTLTGKLRDVTVYFSVSQGYESSLSKVLVSLIDITERKRVERANRQLSIDLDATLQAIPDMLFEIDSKGVYINVWAKESNHLLLDKEKLIGSSISDVLPQHAAEVAKKTLEETLQNGYSTGNVYYLDFSSGRRWFELSVTLKAEFNVSEEHFIVLARDITDRKKVENKLKVSQERLSKAEIVASIGHVEYNYKNGTSHWSNGTFEILGVADELRDPDMEMFLEMVVHNDDSERVRSAMEESVKKLTKFDEVYRILDFAGNEKIIHSTGQVQIDKDGTPGNFFGIIQDITLMHQLNAQLFAEEEKFRMLAEHSPVGIFISRGKKPVYANRPLMELFEVDSVNSFEFDSLITTIHPEDKAKVRLLKEKLNKGEQFKTPFKLTLRRLIENHVTRYYDVRISSFNIHNVEHLQFIVVDKTEEYENEQIKQQLSASLLYIDQKSKFVNDIETNLKIILSSSSRFEKADFQPIVDILRSYTHVDKDWDVLNTHIENVHPQFIANLKEHNVSLSSNDIKHCVCIRLNLDTKEIARIFNVKPSSVQTSRVRLKKKLQLPETTDLREFILGL